MHRRHFLMLAAAAAAQLPNVAADEIPANVREQLARQRLRAILPSRQKIDGFVKGVPGAEGLSRNDGYKFDADLGWVLGDSVRPDGVHNSKTYYHYEADGARKVVQGAGRPCRIHTYGDSFTHGDQVSDGETWQEYLAAHLQEPLRNYGVGGYSMYQAYRRMLKVEAQQPAQYIILNIYDDDHFRNLDAWRSIRVGPGSRCGLTLPHVRVDVARERCTPVENLMRRPEDVYQLCDEAFVWKTFQDDPVLQLVLAAASKDSIGRQLTEAVAVRFGLSKEDVADTEVARRVAKVHTTAALFATRTILRWTEQFVAQTGKRLLVVLSFSQANLRAYLEGKPRFDQELVDWLQNKPYPVIDMREAFRAEFAKSKQAPAAFLKPYYNGHHTPAGNFFTAWALKDPLVQWLDPKPLPYRAE